MTLAQFITSCRLVMGDKHINEIDVLETVEDCLEEEFEAEDDLELKLSEFKEHYEKWVEHCRRAE